MQKMTAQNLTVKPKPTKKIWLSYVFLFLFTAGVMYACFYYGKRVGNASISQNNQTITELNDKVNIFEKQLTKLKENVVLQERRKQIQDEAYKQMSEAYQSAEEKNSLLISELDFYRSIISPKDDQQGPAIQSLDVWREKEGVAFKVTLVQSVRHKNQISGSARVFLYADKDRSQVLAKWPVDTSRSINYQYFERFSGQFEVAEVPEGATIKVDVTLVDGTKLERWVSLPAAN